MKRRRPVLLISRCNSNRSSALTTSSASRFEKLMCDQSPPPTRIITASIFAPRVRTGPATLVVSLRPVRPKVLILLLTLWLGAAHAEPLPGKVIKVADGDTVTILSGKQAHRVRLAGIDAPEKGQPFAEVARKSLASMVAGRQVSVEAHKTDRYGRRVGIVNVDGHDVGLLQIERGYAWHYKQYEREQTPEVRLRYAKAEEEARRGTLGLWRDKNPVPPWEWRRRPRESSRQ
jgi:endonuclease YncB( thermonuclease family)